MKIHDDIGFFNKCNKYLLRFRRVMVKSYCSTQIQQYLQMFMGTILKVKLK